MVELTTKSLEQMVVDQAITAQAQAPGKELDFSQGSVFRAFAESFGAIGMWLQGLILRVLAATRAATSRGPDLDSWMADYGVSRTTALPAKGVVQFSRFTPGIPAVVPVGATVKTDDGAWSYRVTGVASMGFDATQQGYVIAAGASGINLPVEAITPGAGGNADANTVTLLSTAIPGVDTVTNLSPLVGGVEAESDEALLQRFRAYINSLPRAVRPAIDYAISQVQAGLSWTVLDSQMPNGNSAPAYFTVVVDDGTGNVSTDLTRRVYAAVEEVRALGVSFAVVAPVVVTAQVTMAITTLAGEDHAAVVGVVGETLTNYINNLPLGSGLSYTRLANIAYEASPLVTNVTSYLLNGQAGDIAASPRQAIRAGNMNIS